VSIIHSRGGNTKDDRKLPPHRSDGRLGPTKSLPYPNKAHQYNAEAKSPSIIASHIPAGNSHEFKNVDSLLE